MEVPEDVRMWQSMTKPAMDTRVRYANTAQCHRAEACEQLFPFRVPVADPNRTLLDCRWPKGAAAMVRFRRSIVPICAGEGGVGNAEPGPIVSLASPRCLIIIVCLP